MPRLKFAARDRLPIDSRQNDAALPPRVLQDSPCCIDKHIKALAVCVRVYIVLFKLYERVYRLCRLSVSAHGFSFASKVCIHCSRPMFYSWPKESAYEGICSSATFLITPVYSDRALLFTRLPFPFKLGALSFARQRVSITRFH